MSDKTLALARITRQLKQRQQYLNSQEETMPRGTECCQNVLGEVATGAMSGNKRNYKRRLQPTGVQTTEDNKQIVDTYTIGFQ